MTPRDLIRDLSRRGVCLYVDGAQLRYRARPGAIQWARAEAPPLLAAVTAAEDVLDSLAGTRPTEAEWRTACDHLVDAWFELFGRYEAHTEAATCPHGTVPVAGAECARCWLNRGRRVQPERDE